MIHTSRDAFSPALIASGGPCELVDGRFAHGPRTLADVLRRVAGHGDAAMTVVEGRRHSYREALEAAAGLSGALAGMDVGRGSRVALVMGNGFAWMTGFLAVAALGAVPVLVNSRGAADELRHAVESLDCVVVLADAERARLLRSAWADPVAMLVTDEVGWARAVAAGGALGIAETDPSDPGAVLFTSGTTGRPKGALLSQGALAHGIGMGELLGAMNDACRAAESGIATPGKSINSPTIIGGPLFHLGGVNPFLRCLWSGVPTLLNGKWDAELIIDMIVQGGVSRIAMVPTMYWDLLRSAQDRNGRAGQGALDGVKVISSGAAPILPDLVAALVAAIPGVLLSNTYGSTETSGYVASIMGSEFLAHQDACGHILPTTQMRLLTDEGRDAATGEPGEICVRGPCVMDGYIGDETGEAFTDGWFRTGDVGVMDPGGRLRIVDRKKNMIISGGENIYCAEVERVLSEHPDVREVLAFGLPDARLGERLAVAVLPKPGSALSEGEVKDQARARLAIFKVPRDVILAAEALPRTASGKIDRGAVIAWAKGRL